MQYQFDHRIIQFVQGGKMFQIKIVNQLLQNTFFLKMEYIPEDDEVLQIPIKKKPKIQEPHNANLNSKQQNCSQQANNKSNQKRIDLKIQASLLDSLKFTENIQPDIPESSLKVDFTEWEHQNFVFKLRQQSQNSKVEYDDKIIQYFSDFNQKWNIYPYKHFVDLKPETDYVIMKQPLCESKKVNKKYKRQKQIKVIPLKQSDRMTAIKIKLELK
ncbi:unnamed protein product [Paramecium octaurelia]|uniref:Uncharacterized protein n=1 Tax=Paramecium octaurelia TaxID=43137 RepID=A0A8S1XLG2_PAROT|nr:unnamed protein product [Paramecium octaurelia]